MTPCAREGRAVRAGKPAAGVLEPVLAFRVLEAVLQLIGHAAAEIDVPRLLQCLRARLSRLGFDSSGEGAAGRDIRKRNAKQSGGVLAPRQSIAVDVPFVGDIADRLQNGGRIGPRRWIARLGSRHGSFLQFAFYASRATLGATPKHSGKLERYRTTCLRNG